MLIHIWIFSGNCCIANTPWKNFYAISRSARYRTTSDSYKQVFVCIQNRISHLYTIFDYVEVIATISSLLLKYEFTNSKAIPARNMWWAFFISSDVDNLCTSLSPSWTNLKINSKIQMKLLHGYSRDRCQFIGSYTVVSLYAKTCDVAIPRTLDTIFCFIGLWNNRGGAPSPHAMTLGAMAPSRVTLHTYGRYYNLLYCDSADLLSSICKVSRRRKTEHIVLAEPCMIHNNHSGNNGQCEYGSVFTVTAPWFIRPFLIHAETSFYIASRPS